MLIHKLTLQKKPKKKPTKVLVHNDSDHIKAPNNCSSNRQYGANDKSFKLIGKIRHGQR